ncbi:MAG: 30S ribosomal protein S19 [Candidatus Gottesmanbacteria bacterium]
MSRSSKKGPYIDKKLLTKIQIHTPEPIKTWSRDCQIPPEFVNHRFAVHTGRDFKEIFINEAMVGHRLGEFAPTRTFHGHGQVTKRVLEKT